MKEVLHGELFPCVSVVQGCVCLEAEPWLGVKGELGLFLLSKMTMLWHTRNEAVGLKFTNICLVIEKSSNST